MSDKENEEPKPYLNLNYLRLRRYLGLLGILLPIILLIGDSIANGSFRVQCTISHYYFTKLGDVFVGILWAFGLFLLSYRGHSPKENEIISDNIITSVAGVMAIIVSLFPTLCSDCSICKACNVHSSDFIDYVHLISAGIFFLFIGGMSFFKFSKSDKNKSIYKACGIIIWVCLAVLILEALLGEKIFYFDYFIIESIALFAFGFSWMVKGRVLEEGVW